METAPGERQASDWKPVIAVLANPDQRLILGRLLAGQSPDEAEAGMSAKKQNRALQALKDSGLVVPLDGELTVDTTMFAEILRANSEPSAQGIDRFLDGPKIRQYPKSPETRTALLQWVADHAFRVKEQLTEPEVNQRLHPFSEDVATLRRFLVDHDLLRRSPGGSVYETLRVQ